MSSTEFSNANEVVAAVPPLLQHVEPQHASHAEAAPAAEDEKAEHTSDAASAKSRSLEATQPALEKSRSLEATQPALEKGEVSQDAEVNSKILHGRKLALVFVGMLLSILLIALDQTILAPALPVIASQFQALDQLGWVASAYFLTQAAFILLAGQILTIFDRKWTFMVAIALFELGSLFCGIAQSVEFLIFGRAVAGLGASGIFVAVLAIIAEVTLLEDRPKLLGTFGMVFGVSSVAGPLLGGAFTDHATWRWCFFINLPVGAITVATILFLLPASPADPMAEAHIRSTEAKIAKYSRGKLHLKPGGILFRLMALDAFGSFLMLGLVTMLLLALQWGGEKYPWDDKIIIGLFCGFAGLLPVFLYYEHRFVGNYGILPLRYFNNRNQVGACIISFCAFWLLLAGTYYLPLQYQALKHHSATKSGIDILPYMLGLVFSAGAAGVAISKIGYYWPFLFIGPIFSGVGSGLFFTFDVNSSNGMLIGYQIIFAVGIGLVLQNVLIAIQADVDEKDVPQATALLTLTQLFGGVIGLAVCTTIFGNTLGAALEKYAPGSNTHLVKLSTEAVWNEAITPASVRPGVIRAYSEALGYVYIVGVPLAGISMAATFLVRNHNIKGKQMMPGGA